MWFCVLKNARYENTYNSTERNLKRKKEKKTFHKLANEEIKENWYLLDNEHFEDQFIMACYGPKDHSEYDNLSSSER